MKMIKNPDPIVLKNIIEAIKANNGYCPCVLQRNEDTKCPCLKFRNTQYCCCGLYTEGK